MADAGRLDLDQHFAGLGPSSCTVVTSSGLPAAGRAPGGRPNCAANGAAAWSTMTGTAPRRAGSSGGSRSPTASASTATTSSRWKACCRHALRRRCLRAFVRDRTLLEAVASSLTEMFSPNIISQRVAGMLKNYDFVSEDTLAYFTPRLTQAPRRRRLRAGLREAHRARARNRTRCWARCASSATCSGRSSMRCTSPMSSRPAAARRLPALIAEGTRSRACARGVKLRSRWTRVRGRGSMAPERMFVPDEIALDVLRLVGWRAQRGRDAPILAARPPSPARGDPPAT
jgi:hypothetical protein